MGSGASVSETARKKTDKRQLIGRPKKRNLSPFDLGFFLLNFGLVFFKDKKTS